ncbi:MAG: hemin uptake protein HemP [Burkholderiaceae bacterium]
MSSDSSTNNCASASTPEQPCPAGAAYAPSVPNGEHATSTRLSSQYLLGAASEIEIEHNGAIHRLRRTALGKLILIK